jgi:hypothetical protein
MQIARKCRSERAISGGIPLADFRLVNVQSENRLKPFSAGRAVIARLGGAAHSMRSCSARIALTSEIELAFEREQGAPFNFRPGNGSPA